MAPETPVKVTIRLEDRELYRAIRHAAVERDETISSVVTAALRLWLEEYEDASDRAAAAATEGERSYDWEQVKAEMQAARRGHAE
jgi:Arc/MetJ-type ribon-helix-helix transcriptional regulator